MDFEWRLNQAGEVMFILATTGGDEIAGLGTAFTVQIARNGEDFAAGAGTKSEIGFGWYRYVNTVKEAGKLGQAAIRITAAGAAQQNLVGIVK